MDQSAGPADAVAAAWAASGQTLTFSMADCAAASAPVDADAEAAAILETVQQGGWTPALEQVADSLRYDDDDDADGPPIVNDRATRAGHDRAAELLHRDLAAGKISEREAAPLIERLTYTGRSVAE